MGDFNETNDLIHSATNTQVVDPVDLPDTTYVNASWLLYMRQAEELNAKAQVLGATIKEQQEHISFINDIISEMNNCTDQKTNGLNLANHQNLQEMLEKARQLGVKLPEKEKLEFDSLERDRLLENLHLAVDNWTKDNRNKVQTLEIYLKALDRILMLAKEAAKNNRTIGSAANAGMKGG